MVTAAILREGLAWMAGEGSQYIYIETLFDCLSGWMDGGTVGFCAGFCFCLVKSTLVKFGLL